jgi:RNA polymerase-binding transcription factor DksA
VKRASQLDHSRRLLLEKQRELLDSTVEAGIRLSSAGASRGDSIEEGNAAGDAELQIRLHQTDGPLLRAIENALGRISQGTYGECSGMRTASPVFSVVRCSRPFSKLWHP